MDHLGKDQQVVGPRLDLRSPIFKLSHQSGVPIGKFDFTCWRSGVAAELGLEKFTVTKTTFLLPVGPDDVSKRVTA